MKKLLTFIILSFLNIGIGNCQQISYPSLTVDDFEKALTNITHLSKILEKHNFEHSTTGETKVVITPETMPNPLIPDLRAFMSESWEPKNQGDQPIVKVSFYEWEPNYTPLQDVIKTIRVIMRRNSTYADKTNELLQEIKNKYPNRSKGYFGNSESYKLYGEPYNVFTNGSKIEVRTETVKPIYRQFYIVNFDLIK